MRFYVPVGPRGVLFHIGMVATRVMGSLTYWYGSRRRSVTPAALSPHSHAQPRATSADLDLPHSLTPQPVVSRRRLAVGTDALRIPVIR